jgi:hypothetical protein
MYRIELFNDNIIMLLVPMLATKALETAFLGYPSIFESMLH